MNQFPALKSPPLAVQDTGVLRYGDGFITAVYPPLDPHKADQRTASPQDQRPFAARGPALIAPR